MSKIGHIKLKKEWWGKSRIGKFLSPKFEREGFSAESLIEGRLVLFSNPAKPKPDEGVDFVCELSKEHSPLLARFFGVQAKGTKRFKDSWSDRFSKKTVEKWLRLPFPVFIIVYDDYTRNCYWFSVIHNIDNLLEKIRKNQKSETIEIEAKKIHALEEDGEVTLEFIQAIKSGQMLIGLIRGRPDYNESYVRTIPRYVLSKQVRMNHKLNIRDSMNILIYHYLLTNDVKKAYPLCEFLTKFDKGHYDHFFLFGQMQGLLGKKDKALANFNQAIGILRRDKKWDKRRKSTQLSTGEIIAIIEREKERLLAKR